MKKGNGQAGHRQTASSSVGIVSIKARGSGTQAATDNSTNNTSGGTVGMNERTGYHQGGAHQASASGNQASGKPTNPFSKQSGQNTAGGGGGAQSAAAASGQERKCDSCKYRTPINQCTTFRCRDCGTYIICEYCYEDYMEKGGYYDGSNEHIAFNKKIQCVYCWSRHTLTDICVKTLKSLGFMPVKGSNKIQISNLTREKIKKLSNLRVIQKTLVYVIGIAPEIASEEKLKSVEYFGQYGNLQKVVVNTKDVYNATRGGPSYSAYLTFNSARESAIAILSVDQFVLNDRMIRASFGTSKFCQFFLNNQKCNNRDCLYLHELRADLEAYTKEDMQNNKFIFLEQQKIAIKLSKALDLSKDQFNKYNIDRNETLRVASDRATKTGVPLKPILPEPSFIYHKDFHFLDEPLIERQKKREAALAAKVAAQKAAAATANEIDSASTAATTASAGAAPPTSAKATSGPVTKHLTGKQMKQGATNVGEALLGGIMGGATANSEESKQASAMPIFTNQKDVSNQARKQSQLRAPLSKALLAGSQAAAGDSSSAKSSNQAYNSNTSAVANSENRANASNTATSEPASSSQAKAGAKATDSKEVPSKVAGASSNTLFPFEPFKAQTESTGKTEKQSESGKEPTSQANVAVNGAKNTAPAQESNENSGEHMNILQKNTNQSGATIFQNLLHTQLANQAAQNEKISSASAAAAERFRKKEMNQKKKKKIVVESSHNTNTAAIVSTREQVPASIEQANIKKVDTTALAAQTSPVKLNTGKEVHVQPTPAPVPAEEHYEHPPAATRTGQHHIATTNQKRAGPQQQSHNDKPLREATDGQVTKASSNAAYNSMPAKQNLQASSSQPPNKFTSMAAMGRINSESAATLMTSTKDKQALETTANSVNVGGKGGANTVNSNNIKQTTQAMSVGSYKKFGGLGVVTKDDHDLNDTESPQSPALQYSRVQSRFQFAHSVDPIKKEGGFKFGFGLRAAAATSSELDKDEIVVPMKVQELIHRSIRTLSDSVSNRSGGYQHQDSMGSGRAAIQLPFGARDASSSLVPVEEREIEHELEKKWYTFEEQAQEDMMQQRDGHASPMFEESKGPGDGANTSMNPFRMLNKKDKEPQQAVGMSNLDVKRVKYSYKQTSPSGEDKYLNSEHQADFSASTAMTKEAGGAAARGSAANAGHTTSPFQPSAGGKESLRQNKGGRRAGPQAERARQPPNNR